MYQQTSQGMSSNEGDVNSSDAEGSPEPQTGERVLLKVPRRALMRVFEKRAVRFFEKHENNTRHEEYIEGRFVSLVKKSPSARTVELAIAIAAEARWHWALGELLAMDVSSYKAVKSTRRQHPFLKKIVTSLELPGVHKTKGEGYRVGALLRAITQGQVETVRILMKHVDISTIDDVSGEPILHYVYLVEERDLRELMLCMILPKMKPSLSNLNLATKHGDIETMQRIKEGLDPSDRASIVPVVVKEAIEDGGDEVAE